MVLQVERDVEEQREHRGRHAQRRQLHAGEGRLLEQLQREHRLGHARLDHEERGQQHRGGGEERHDERAAPALLVASQQPEYQQEQRAAECREAAPIDASRVRVAALTQLEVGHGDRRNAHRHVDEEDPLPAERVDERAADERPDGHRDADRGAVDAHRHAALAAGGELLCHERERDREHDRAADALDRAGHVQEGRVGRQARGERRHGEDRQAEREDAAATQAVGE